MISAGRGAALLALGGTVGSAAILVFWPAGWTLGLALVAVAAYGLQEIARHTPGREFTALRWFATGIGALSAAALLLLVFGRMLMGSWT